MDEEVLDRKDLPDDFRKAEDFINLMCVLYTPTLCVSTEKNPTCGQILPILQKLEMHFADVEGDTGFVSNLKKQVWANLSKRYQSKDIRNFREMATALDPCFKQKMDNSASVWNQIKREMMTESEQNHLPANNQESLQWRNFLPMWMHKRCHYSRGGPCPSRTRERRRCRCLRRHHQPLRPMTLLPSGGTSTRLQFKLALFA
ncbi:uncharacterized protein LOC123981923 isoform X2 [Micropterus dolomieu]|uniref:uncharacterized protein LOC123981923 isoform X2 n=1 Tax=Micropterus dolomieu TaxID=147949 RepID=UPI001E8DFA96|nr:uncharacterized protein LOC123981923 isoform X2 [Micropterus dolomieu]